MTKQSSLEDKKNLSQRRYFGCKEKYQNIADGLRKEESKQVCKNRTVRFRQKIPELLDSATNALKWHLTST
jgi:hypothetical protein